MAPSHEGGMPAGPDATRQVAQPSWPPAQADAVQLPWRTLWPRRRRGMSQDVQLAQAMGTGVGGRPWPRRGAGHRSAAAHRGAATRASRASAKGTAKGTAKRSDKAGQASKTWTSSKRRLASLVGCLVAAGHSRPRLRRLGSLLVSFHRRISTMLPGPSARLSVLFPSSPLA